MIKTLVIPAVLALVVGLAGSAGYSVMHARTEHAAQLVTLDSLAKAYTDSVQADSAHADSLHGDSAHVDSLAADSLLAPTTDSIRALLDAHAGDDHADPASGTAAAPKAAPAPTKDASGGRTTILGAGSKPADSAAAPKRDDLNSAATAASRAIAESANETIPERRLAKIFGAMSARDAAKVLEQMSDGDVRTILALMADRQAAAVLAALPASRAALISIGRAPRPIPTPDSGSTTP